MNIFLAIEIEVERNSNDTVTEYKIQYVDKPIVKEITKEVHHPCVSLIEQRNLERHDYCNKILADNYNHYLQQHAMGHDYITLDSYYKDDTQECILSLSCPGCDGFTPKQIYKFK